MNTKNFIFFWSHHEKANKVTKACMSQWYPSEFVYNGNKYCCAEQAMMAGKALAMNDQETLEKILVATDPEKIKALGRSVKNWNEEVWNKVKFNLVCDINFCKFSQNESLRNYLLSTGDATLVEASPYDTIWGIGMKSNDPDIEDPTKWRGQNLLGKAIMNARQLIRGIK